MGKIIRLSKRNLNELARIDYEAQHPLEKHLKAADYKRILRERFELGHEIFFGYKEGRELKGYAALKPFFPGHKHCEACWIAVRKKYQGRGIGKALMKFVEGYAKKKKFRKVCVYTNKALKRVRNFYEKQGYRFVNEFPGYYSYAKNNTSVLYAKRI
ncbi:GNAT family N-acetyltransferase [Candidatus Woesearchaeota archaeon]|nr:GNAT family N-acetyltransferase [Candidatus Woesearchaeota archaeon]